MVKLLLLLLLNTWKDISHSDKTESFQKGSQRPLAAMLPSKVELARRVACKHNN